MNCVFCRIVKKELPAHTVFENDHWLAFLDIKPVNLGHTLLVPKTHYDNLLDLPTNLATKALPLIQKIAAGVQGGTGAAGFNLGLNNGAAAGQLINHVHFHIIPRLIGDGHRHWHGRTIPSDEELAAVEKKILSALESAERTG